MPVELQLTIILITDYSDDFIHWLIVCFIKYSKQKQFKKKKNLFLLSQFPKA